MSPFPLVLALAALAFAGACSATSAGSAPQVSHSPLARSSPRVVANKVYRCDDTVDISIGFQGPFEGEENNPLCRASIRVWFGPDVTCTPDRNGEPTWESDGFVDLPLETGTLEGIAVGQPGTTVTMYVSYVERCEDQPERSWGGCETYLVPDECPQRYETWMELSLLPPATPQNPQQ